MKTVTKSDIQKLLMENMPDKNLFIDFNDDFSQLGMDSIQFIQFVVSLEEIFDCEIPDTKLIIDEMNTINKVYDLLCLISDDKRVEI